MQLLRKISLLVVILTLVTVPVSAAEEKFKVVFRDINNSVIRELNVNKFGKATPPYAPDVVGYEFKGWSQDTKSVTQNMDVNAIYTYVGTKEKKKKDETVTDDLGAAAMDDPNNSVQNIKPVLDRNGQSIDNQSSNVTVEDSAEKEARAKAIEEANEKAAVTQNKKYNTVREEYAEEAKNSLKPETPSLNTNAELVEEGESVSKFKGGIKLSPKDKILLSIKGFFSNYMSWVMVAVTILITGFIIIKLFLKKRTEKLE